MTDGCSDSSGRCPTYGCGSVPDFDRLPPRASRDWTSPAGDVATLPPGQGRGGPPPAGRRGPGFPGVCDAGPMRIYTKAGDDGTTGLFLGGRVSKADALMAACGDLDESVAVLGVARAALGASVPPAGADLSDLVLTLQRDLFVVAADLATNPDHRDRLKEGISLVTAAMVARLEEEIDARVARHPLRPVFIVPGANPASAALDHARTVVRRAERAVVGLAATGHPVTAEVTAYVNRLSDLVFVLARAAAGEVDEPPSHE